MLNETLFKRLESHANEVNLPILDNQSFDRYTNEFGKDVFRWTLSEYIAKVRPKFPLKPISDEDMRSTFSSLKKADYSIYCSPIEQVEKEIFEKYDDLEYPFSKYGLGIIDAPSTYNPVSNYFHQDLRLACSSYGFRAPLEVWQNGTAKDIWKCFGPIWRGINGVKKVMVEGKEELRGGKLDEASYLSAFRLGTYIATQFKPIVAKCVYEMTDAKRVLDTSCGWGDRLAGFFASNAEEYYGCDPNPNTYMRYTEQIDRYNRLLSKPKKVKIWNCGAEDLPYDELPDIDVAFTSPPYFSTEEYNKGGEKEENQSWFKFDEYEKWRDDFYLPVAEKSMNVSRFMFCNIMDPKIKSKRYRSSDELVNHLKDKFIGQIGMRIMQRPKSDKLFKDEKEKADFMNKMFIENVWCFGDKDFDLFRDSRKGTLENFFA